MRYQHVFWDFDGTLFDTYPAMMQAFVQALAQEGTRAEEAQVYALMKESMGTAMSYFGKREDRAFAETFARVRAEAEEKLAKPFPCAVQVCRSIAQQGGWNYLLTHRGHSALTHLRRWQMEGYFRACITKADGFPRKPDPAGLLSVLAGYHIPCADAVMVGDRELDIQAARRAGIAACLFDPEKNAPTCGEDYRITSLDEILLLK